MGIRREQTATAKNSPTRRALAETRTDDMLHMRDPPVHLGGVCWWCGGEAKWRPILSTSHDVLRAGLALANKDDQKPRRANEYTAPCSNFQLTSPHALGSLRHYCVRGDFLASSGFRPIANLCARELEFARRIHGAGRQQQQLRTARGKPSVCACLCDWHFKRRQQTNQQPQGRTSGTRQGGLEFVRQATTVIVVVDHKASAPQDEARRSQRCSRFHGKLESGWRMTPRSVACSTGFLLVWLASLVFGGARSPHTNEARLGQYT